MFRFLWIFASTCVVYKRRSALYEMSYNFIRFLYIRFVPCGLQEPQGIGMCGGGPRDLLSIVGRARGISTIYDWLLFY